MASPSDPGIDTEELMARVRATLGPSDAAQDVGGSPVVLSPHFHQEQLLLDQAQRVVGVGATVPPFGGLNPLLRPLARLATKALYFLLQVITVDQRVFNGLLLNVARMTSAGLAQGEATLNEKLSQWKAALAGRDRRIEALESTVAALQTTVGGRERRLADLEEKSAETHRLGELFGTANDALREQSARLSVVETALAQAERALRDAEQRWNERLDRGDGALGDLRKRVAAAQTSVSAQERRLTRLANAAMTPDPSQGAAQARALASEAAHALDALYVDFEQYFRGSEEDIKGRLDVYLPDVRAVLSGPGQVVDLGCGRGEWLSLLREQGITARGIDANRVQVERCRSAGFDVVEGDALQMLATLGDGSVDVVTAFHLVEHLRYGAVVELFDHVVRVLRRGGLFILETPNPDNVLVGSCQFYLDPTHRHPLPSPLAKFLAEARGLHDVAVRPLHPAPEYEHLRGSDVAERLNRYFCGPRDYAILGFKA